MNNNIPINFILLLILSIVANLAKSQETLSGLDCNPVLKSEIENLGVLKSNKTIIYQPISLPFFDDFRKGIYPDTSRWIDNKCYVNSDFPLFPPNHGVATLDAIDGNGMIYSNSNFFQFQADELTSRPIRLDSIFNPSPRAITKADSVYLSFFYQPQGRGNPPEDSDSLVLQFGFYTPDSVFQFIDSIQVPLSLYIGPNDTIYPGDILYSPCDDTWGTQILEKLTYNDTVNLPCDSVYVRATQWYYAWSSKGMSLDTFRFQRSDSAYFRQVIIPVMDSALFYRNDFQFRFINYASLASSNLTSWQSNCDFWNIDFVYLNMGRSINDTVYRKIGFINPAPSMLKNYQAMPYDQYAEDPTGEIKAGLDILMSNMDIINQTGVYQYLVRDNNGANVSTYPGGSWSMEPFSTYGYIDYIPFRYPEVNFFFKLFGNQDTASFRIDHILAGDPLYNPGDTITFIQNFSNYYAYDDGTPEFGYGLSPAGSKLAYRFTLNKRDTLRAVQIYFNNTAANANVKDFFLTVWNDVNGQPGDIIYSKPRQKPSFTDEIYDFTTYYLDSALPVRGTFYVGMIQTTDDNLNIGFDAANNSGEHIFYNVIGKWAKSIFKGSLMIRPLLGKQLIDYPTVTPNKNLKSINVFPNPNLTGILHLIPDHTKIDPDLLRTSDLSIYNMLGQRIVNGEFKSEIDLTGLIKGIYFLKISSSDGKELFTEKIIISF